MSYLYKIIKGEEKRISYDNIIHKKQWLDIDQPPLPVSKANTLKKKDFIVYIAGLSRINPS